MTVPGALVETPPTGRPGVTVGGPDGLSVVGTQVRQARAYCGPAHGRSWALAAEGPPAASVDIEVEGSTVAYRLVLHPRTRRPIRDDHGSFLYMPVRRVISQRTGD